MYQTDPSVFTQVAPEVGFSEVGNGKIVINRFDWVGYSTPVFWCQPLSHSNYCLKGEHEFRGEEGTRSKAHPFKQT